jgi:hypothetical protein
MSSIEISDWQLDEWTERHPELLQCDGFEKALLGLCEVKGREACLAYDYEGCVDILIDRDGMSREDAVEYMAYNVTDAYVGEHTPAFIELVEKEAD